MKTIKKSILLLISIIAFSCGKDDGPTMAENKAPEIKAQSFNASEAAADSDVLGTVKATDADQDELSYSITANSDNLFEITKTGALSLAASKSLDFETKATHEIIVEVSDGKAKASAKITITVIDVDENQAPVAADQPFSIDENSAANVAIGTIVATDPDNDTLSFSVTSTTPANSKNLFELDANTGQLKSKTETLNFEAQANYVLNVEVSDGNLTTTVDITVNVTDVNDVPVFGDDPTTFTVPEDINDTTVIGTLTATDEDGDTTKFTLNDSSNSSNFELDADSGELSLRAGASLDYETRTSYVFNARVNDGLLSADPITITVNVTDIIESNINVSTFAGDLTAGLVNGVGQSARFNGPSGMVKDAAGNIYLADTANNVIRKIDAASGTVSTYAGSGTRGWADDEFNRLAAWFSDPTGLAIDAAGNIYVADQGNHRIRKITSSGVTTVAGGGPGFINDNQAKLSAFNFPTSVAVDTDGNLYVADLGNHAIRKIAVSGKVTTMAGDGTAGFLDGAASQTTRLSSPVGIVVDNRLNELYIADSGNKRIRTLGFKGANSGRLSTLITPTAGFLKPYGIALNTNDGTLYISDFDKNLIYKAEVGVFGEYTTSVLAGSMTGYLNGPGNTSRFRRPWGILIDASEDLFISDYGNNTIRKITIN